MPEDGLICKRVYVSSVTYAVRGQPGQILRSTKPV